MAYSTNPVLLRLDFYNLWKTPYILKFNLLTHYLFFKGFLIHYKRFLLLFRILKTKFKQIIILYYYFTILKPKKKKEKIERLLQKTGDIYGVPDPFKLDAKSFGNPIFYYKPNLLFSSNKSLKYVLNRPELRPVPEQYVILGRSSYRNRSRTR